jgi:hypothetical protein
MDRHEELFMKQAGSVDILGAVALSAAKTALR